MLIPRQGPEDPGCTKVGTVAVTAVGVTRQWGGVADGVWMPGRQAVWWSLQILLMIHLLWVFARRGI